MLLTVYGGRSIGVADWPLAACMSLAFSSVQSLTELKAQLIMIGTCVECAVVSR